MAMEYFDLVDMERMGTQLGVRGHTYVTQNLGKTTHTLPL